MRNRLQYAYTIGVFIGVLTTAYMMMNRDGNERLPFASMQSPVLKNEATFVDPAVSSLFETENELARRNSDKIRPIEKRSPTENRPVR